MRVAGRVAKVLSTSLEFAPEPATEYLSDRTAFDAFIDYESREGGRAFLGIETKLTDTFSQTSHDTPHYRRWMASDRSPWRLEAQTAVANVCHNQLWRDHLLAIAMRDHPRSSFQRGTFVLVGHPDDRKLSAVVDGYRRLLVKGDDTFVDLPLDQLLRAWGTAELNEVERSWPARVQQRYLDLRASGSW